MTNIHHTLVKICSSRGANSTALQATDHAKLLRSKIFCQGCNDVNDQNVLTKVVGSSVCVSSNLVLIRWEVLNLTVASSSGIGKVQIFMPAAFCRATDAVQIVCWNGGDQRTCQLHYFHKNPVMACSPSTTIRCHAFRSLISCLPCDLPSNFSAKLWQAKSEAFSFFGKWTKTWF